MPESVNAEELAEALARTHPDYEDMLDQWNKYIDCYAAVDIYKYIYQHSREHAESWQMRVKRGYYYNYVASIVDLYVAYLFEGAITRTHPKSLEQPLQDLYEDATRSGTKYNLFLQMAETFAVAAGHVGLLIDMPEGGGTMTVEDAKRLKHRPYLSIIQAQQILDWELDEAGAFRWVKIEIPTKQERSWRQAVDTKTRTFVIWDREHWEKWELRENNGAKQAILIAESDHPVGEVPLVILKNKKSLLHPWFGESAVRDICDINIAILNWSSFADEEVANRCLNILTMQESGEDTPIEITHYNVLSYAEGADRPQYLAPSETVLKLIGEQIQDARSEIYRLAKLSGSTGLLGVREATSGVAYAFEFNETNQSLAAKAQHVEQAEADVHRIYAKWIAKDASDTSIAYPREFGVDDFLVELQTLTEARATLTSDTAIRELEKRVTSKLFSRESQELRDNIAKEIESASLRRGRMLAPGSFEEVFSGQGNPSREQPSQEGTSQNGDGTNER